MDPDAPPLADRDPPGAPWWVGVLVLAAVTLWAFAPTLDHPARADHLLYFAEVSHLSQLSDLVLDFWSYTRVRTFTPGDSVLFRPLMYVLFGVETWLFGFAPFWWQAVNLGLHLAVVGVLFGLLRRRLPDPVALPATLWLATLLVSAEMVAWHHMQAYLLAFLLILLGVRQAWQAEDPAAVGALVGVACFLYEIALPFAFVFTAYFLARRALLPAEGSRRPSLRACFLPLVGPLLYLVTNAIDHLWLHPTSLGVGQFSRPLTLSATLSNAATVTTSWLGVGLFPLQAEVSVHLHRMVIGLGGAFFARVSLLDPLCLPGWVVLGAALSRLGAVTRQLDAARRQPRARDHLLQASLPLALAVVFVGLVVVGRINPRGLGYIQSCLYYSYPFWILTALGVAALFEAPRAPASTGRHVLVVCLWTLAVANAARVRVATAALGEVLAPQARLLAQTAEFVQRHRHEPGFSFAIEASEAADPRFQPQRLRPDQRTDYSVSRAYYAHLLEDDCPAWVLRFDDRGDLVEVQPDPCRRLDATKPADP